ncbi:lysine-specific demethylase JMJ26-like [Magnolia sinica]|uniref:lysine-specific demethylase JMJ26-like n=1 Tax=Magnolia sinica TaxID=86752 RepID=UPI002657B8AF|nr:lysine-specific demethylase JMJ26-like [Magnolia sinica]
MMLPAKAESLSGDLWEPEDASSSFKQKPLEFLFRHSFTLPGICDWEIFQVGENGYGFVPSYSSKPYGGLPSTLEIFPVIIVLYQEGKNHLLISLVRWNVAMMRNYTGVARMHCVYLSNNNCKASIMDFHRSCSNCSFDLCLSCCHEIRGGSLPGGIGAVTFNYINKGKAYVHGDKPVLGTTLSLLRNGNSLLPSLVALPEWKANDGNGSVPCPPKELGGCGACNLDLRCIFPLDWIQQLEISAEEIACSYDFPKMLDASSYCPFCIGMHDQEMGFDGKLREAAAREESYDNYLYCPSAKDLQGEDLKHFQQHWIKGQPVVVHNVLHDKSDLSWDPLVFFLPLLERNSTNHGNDMKSVKATDCLVWCEI